MCLLVSTFLQGVKRSDKQQLLFAVYDAGEYDDNKDEEEYSSESR